MPQFAKPRHCTWCGDLFDAGGGTRPPEVCSIDCKRKRQAAHARAHYARKKAEHERLRRVVEQMQSALAV
jgi:hypothetical protein